MSISFEALSGQYDDMYDSAEILPRWEGAANSIARNIIANKARYQEVSDATNGIPWFWIGALHSLEASCSFNCHLHNGDSLRARTHHVPAGRPIHGSPPFTWVESAQDALEEHGLQNIKNWSTARMLYEAERFNGMGYRAHGVPSQYLWSGTNKARPGKYVSDGVWDGSAVSGQLGVVAIIKTIKELDIPKSVIVQASRKLTFMNRLMKACYTTGASVFTLNTLNVAPDFFSRIESMIANNKIAVALGTLAVMALVFKIIETMSVGDAQAGRYTPSGLAPPTPIVTSEPSIKAVETTTNV